MRRLLVLGTVLILLPVMFISTAIDTPSSSALTLTPLRPPIAQFGETPVNVYAGAGTQYAIIGTLFNADAQVIGRTADNGWLHIYFSRTSGWVQTDQVTFTGNLNLLPVQNGLITPTPLPSLTPSPTINGHIPTPTYAPFTATATPAGWVSMTLEPAIYAYTDDQIHETAAILRLRLAFFGIHDPFIEVKDSNSVVVEFDDNGMLEVLFAMLTREGYIELVDVSDHPNPRNLIDTWISTTGRFARLNARYMLALNGTPTPSPTPVSTVPPSFNPATEMPYTTVFDNAMPIPARLQREGELWWLTIPLDPTFSADYVGRHIAVVVDGRVIGVQQLEGDVLHVALQVPERDVIISHAMFQTRALPVPLLVRDVSEGNPSPTPTLVR